MECETGLPQLWTDAFLVLTGRRHVYYGWWLLAGSVLAMAIGSGVSFWAFGLYVGPLEDQFGWSRAEIAGGFSVGLLVSGLAAPLVGRWIDRYGPRRVILVGAVLTAASYLLLAVTDTLWHWFAFQAINAVFRQLMFFIPFQALVTRWFDRRRGIAVGILATGFSLGGFVIVPMSLARLHHRKDVAYRPLESGPTSTVALAWPVDRTTALIDTFVGIVRGRTANSSRT